MKRTGTNIRKHIFSIFASVFINGLVLLMLCQSSAYEHHKKSEPLFKPIFLADYQPPPQTLPPPRSLKRPEPEKQIPKHTPKVSIRHPKVHPKPPRLDFKMPEVKFEINPILRTGMAVAPPPPEPVVRKTPLPPSEPVVSKTPPPSESETVVSKISQPEPAQEPALIQSLPTEFGMEEVDQHPIVLKKIDPLYPYRARRRNISGKVVIKFLVTADGHVRQPSILNSDPKGIFETNALQAVRKWRFKPGYYQGKPVATWMVLPIQFKLNG